MATSERIQENRLWHFRQLVKLAGGNNAAADILGVLPPYVSQLVGTNKQRRNIGDRTAAKIERCFGLASGSLDADPPKQADNDDLYLREIVSTLANASDNDKEFVLAMAQWIASRSSANKVIESSNVPADQGGMVAMSSFSTSSNKPGAVITYDESAIVHPCEKAQTAGVAKSIKLESKGAIRARESKRST